MVDKKKPLNLRYYPRSFETGLEMLRDLRAKYPTATCHLKVQAGEVLLRVTVK